MSCVATKKAGSKTGESNSPGGTFFKATENTNAEPAVNSFFSAVQAKKNSDSKNNKFEKEADAVADKVVNKPAKEHTCEGGCDDDDVTVQQKTNGSDVQAKCAACEAEEKGVQTKQNIEVGSGGKKGKPVSAAQSFSQKLDEGIAGGHALDNATAESMGGKLNADVSNVKIHTDEKAAELNNQINAQAFAKDNHVFFNKNKFNPQTTEGKHLLAHELTHTVQQGAVKQNKPTNKGNGENNKTAPKPSTPAGLQSKKQNAAPKQLAQKPIVDISKDYETIDPAKQAALPGAADAIIKESNEKAKKGGDPLQGMPGVDKLKKGEDKSKTADKKEVENDKGGKEKEAVTKKILLSKLAAKQTGIKSLAQSILFKEDEKLKKEPAKQASKDSLKNKNMAEGHANDFVKASVLKIQQVFTAGNAVHPVIDLTATAARINVRSQMQQQLAKIKAEHTKLKKQAKAKAGSAFATINKNYTSAVSQANAAATSAKSTLDSSFKAENEKLENAYKTQLPKLDGIYTTAADKFKAAGIAAGDYAVTKADNYASTNYDPHVTGIDDSLLDGPLTSDRYEARAKAAREVGKQYRNAEKGLVNAGIEQADKLVTGPGKGKDLQVINDNVEKSRQALKQNYDAATKNVDTSLKQTLDQAKKIKSGLTQSTAKTLKATTTGLTSQEKAMLAQITAIGEGQLNNIDKEAMQSSSSLAQSTIDTIDLLVKGIADFKKNITENNAPAAHLLKAALTGATTGFGNATLNINNSFRKAGMQASMAIAKAAQLTVQEMQQLTQTGIDQSNEIYNGLPPVMGSLISNAISTFKQLSKDFGENTNNALTASTKGFAEISGGIDKFFEAYYKSLTDGLDTSSKEIEKAFKESVDAADFISTIQTEAAKAASEVQPRWKSVLKILLVILVVVIVALVVGPAVIGFVTAGAAALGAGAAAATIGAVVGGAIVGAAAGAVIQMGNNIIDGKPLFEGVAKAAIIGAVSGALGGAGGALGQFITKGAQGLAPALIRFGVDMAFDVGGNIAIEAYEAFKDGRAMNWGEIAKGAAISAGMSVGMGNINKLGKFGAKVEGIQGKSMAFGEGLGGKAGTKIKTSIGVDAPAAPKVPQIDAPEVKVDAPAAPKPTEAPAPKTTTDAPETKVDTEAPKTPKTDAEITAPKTGEPEVHGLKTEAEVKGKAAVDEPKAKVNDEPGPVKKTSETAEVEQKMQTDESTVSKTKSEDGHDLKMDEQGNICKCTTCELLDAKYKEELKKPALKKELDDARNMPEGPARDKAIRDIEAKLKKEAGIGPSNKRWDDKDMTFDEFKADYKDRFPDTKLSADDVKLKEHFDDGMRLNLETGKLKTPIEDVKPISTRDDLPKPGTKEHADWESHSYGDTDNLPCFTAGTKIKTSSGFINIEDIRKGDMVLSFDFQTEQNVEARVSEKFVNWTDFVVLININGEVVESTLSHPFWLPERKIWIAASSLKTGMLLKGSNGESIIVNGIEIEEVVKNTYNFEVENLHTYFVGNNAVLVHNDDSVSKFLSTKEFNSYVYVIRDAETGKVIYVGQSIQEPNTRLTQHLGDPDSAVGQYLRKQGINPDSAGFNFDEHLRMETPVKGKPLTPYELTVQEQHFINKHGGIANLENKINAITPEKYKQYKNLHNPCR